MQGEDDYGGPSAGCTAVCAVVRGNELIVANAGDSRCVFSRNGRAVEMTHDHKPTDVEEFARITKVGARLACCAVLQHCQQGCCSTLLLRLQQHRRDKVWRRRSTMRTSQLGLLLPLRRLAALSQTGA